MDLHLLKATSQELGAAINELVKRIDADHKHLASLYIALGARCAMEEMGKMGLVLPSEE